MVAWHHYAKERKRKKAMYSQAMDEYKLKLQSTGVRQWVLVADSLLQMRERLAADTHAQVRA